MKKKVFSVAASCLMSAILATWIGTSAVLCFAETFELECTAETAVLVCAVGAAVFSLGMLPRRRWPVLVVQALAAVAAAFRLQPQLKAGFERMLFQVTTELARNFPVAITGCSEGDARWFLLPLGLLIVWVTAWVCSRKGSALPVALVCGPVLVCCLLTVGIAPIHWLVVLTCGLILLTVTHSVRRRDVIHGNLLAWRLLIPMVLVAALPLYLSPPEAYVRSEWSDRLLAAAEQRLGIQDYSPGNKIVIPAKWNRQLKKVDLQRVGPKSKSKNEVLQYRADTYITYLRGVSLGVYENNSWSAADPYLYAQEGFSGENQLTGSGASHTLNVYTKRKEDLLYTTYFLEEIPEGSTAIDDAYLENSQNLTEYAIFYSGSGKTPTFAYSNYVKDVYTQLPEELKAALLDYSRQERLIGASAGRIAGHVKNSAVYDLQTPRTPDNQDFVLYFLEESHRGYCVHFASATTLLLRAQGIPARYVTGYSVDGNIGQRNTVTADQSHAWVEYFQEDAGWRVLDPTPADWQEQQEPESQTPEQPTTPETPDTPEPLPEEPQPEEPDTAPETPEEPQKPEEKPQEQKPVIRIPLPSLPVISQPEDGEGGIAAPVSSPQLTIPKVLLWRLFIVAAAAALIPLQRYLRLKWRAHCFGTGSSNKRALAQWRHLKALCRAAHTEPSVDARAIAQKARFSSHAVTGEELHCLAQAVSTATEILRHESYAKQLWHRFVRAFY